MRRAERFLLGMESGSRVDVIDAVNADQDFQEDFEAHFDATDDPFGIEDHGSEDRGYDPLAGIGPAFDESCYDAVGF